MSKLSFEKIKFDKPLDNSLDLSDLLLNIFSKGFNGALNEFIRQVSEECNISMKCAEYYVQKYFNFKWDIEKSDDGRFFFVLEPFCKSVDELLSNNIDEEYVSDVYWECEWELIDG